MITYKKPNKFTGKADVYEYVYLDGKKVGSIRICPNGYRYATLGGIGRYGEIFKTVEECKKSLEDE